MINNVSLYPSRNNTRYLQNIFLTYYKYRVKMKHTHTLKIIKYVLN